MADVAEHISVESYTDDDRETWNEFVDRSKNATFLHDRRYMEYHEDRFEDASAIVRYKDDVLALFPANMKGDTVQSHGGLTYGGVLSDEEMTTPKMLATFDALRHWCLDRGAESMYYKTIPTIYHSIPAQEDLYALFQNQARLVRRDVTSVIYPGAIAPVRDGRRRSIEDAGSSVAVGITRRLTDLERYWRIVRENLSERHDAEPTHSFDEISYLLHTFGEISLFIGSYEGEMVAGVLVYSTGEVDHAQYIASTETGREVGALDAIFHRIARWSRGRDRVLDFGISTEAQGWKLNEGLVFYKESFGARAAVHDFYEVGLI